mmetsp:Transcript_122449/g.305724  ORF Transcript_122449/g.305724 Transcript_122449/m.305724 type:complete len:308 (+) Transcript_122449:268-1191(+)
MVRGLPPAAHGLPAQVIPNDCGVVLPPNAELPQAPHHEDVLAQRVPIHLPALPLALVVSHHCCLGEDLKGAISHRIVRRPREGIAILDERGPTVRLRLQIATEAVRDNNCIRVDLYRPIVVQVLPLALDGIPHVHEELSVSGGAILGNADVRLREIGGVDPALPMVPSHNKGLLAEQVEAVAIEDADIPLLLRSHKQLPGEDVSLIAPGLRDSHAVKRGIPNLHVPRPHRPLLLIRLGEAVVDSEDAVQSNCFEALVLVMPQTNWSSARRHLKLLGLGLLITMPQLDLVAIVRLAALQAKAELLIRG